MNLWSRCIFVKGLLNGTRERMPRLHSLHKLAQSSMCCGCVKDLLVRRVILLVLFSRGRRGPCFVDRPLLLLSTVHNFHRLLGLATTLAHPLHLLDSVHSLHDVPKDRV